MECEEKEREDELHAFQSGEERAGGASERLGLEQLWILFEGRNEFVRSQSAVETESLSWKRGPSEEPELPNHEPFLYESQKKFGTHTSFNRADGERWCRAQGLASRPSQNRSVTTGTLKDEPFLHTPQKRFGTHAGFDRADGANAGAAPKDWPAAQVKTGTSQPEP